MSILNWRNTVRVFSVAVGAAGLGLLLLPTGWTLQPDAGVTLQGQINYADLVPKAIFGNWDRVRKIEKSSAREMVNRVEAGEWEIYKRGDRIMLRNPETDMETEVSVHSVVNDTAVFNYKKEMSQGMWCFEQLTLKAESEGTALSGYQVKECYRPNKWQGMADEPYYYAFARVNGTRRQELPAAAQN